LQIFNKNNLFVKYYLENKVEVGRYRLSDIDIAEPQNIGDIDILYFPCHRTPIRYRYIEKNHIYISKAAIQYDADIIKRLTLR